MSCVDCRQATYLSEFQLPGFSVDPTITHVNGDSEKEIVVGSRNGSIIMINHFRYVNQLIAALNLNFYNYIL